MSEQTTPSIPQQTTPIPKPKSKLKSFIKKLFLSLFLLIGLIVGGMFLYFNYTYSDGYRAGVLIKFSKKGFIFKTYEGDINLGGVNPLPGNTIANNIWQFSVKDAAIAEKLELLQGKNVRLHYKEKVKAMPWQGDTNYIVDEVETVK